MMRSILSVLKYTVSIAAFLCMFGIVGTMDYNDAVEMERAQQSSKRPNCGNSNSATASCGGLSVDATANYLPRYTKSQVELVCEGYTQ
jgi:hypothetical protein